MKKIFNIANLYILLWCLYTLQGVLIPVGSFVSRTVFVVIMLISLYYAYVFFTTQKATRYFRAMNMLLIMFIVYGIILLMFGQTVKGLKVVSNHTYLQHTLMSFLPVYPFYIFSQKGLIHKKMLLIWLLVFVFLVTLKYNYQEQIILENYVWEETVNNIAYVVLVLLPLICLFENRKIIQYVLFGYCMFLILSSFKRGAILIGAFCFVLFMFYSLKSTKGIKKIVIVLGGLVVIAVGYYYIMNLLETSDLFNRRLEATMEGDSSGRDSLYSAFWRIFSTEKNPLRFLIGYGANGTLALVGQYAHNDWLELAIDNGLLGIVLYLNYWICFAKTWRSNENLAPTIRFVFGMTLFIAFAKTLFSMSYTNTPFYVTLTIGYCLAQYDGCDVGFDEEIEEEKR